MSAGEERRRLKREWSVLIRAKAATEDEPELDSDHVDDFIDQLVEMDGSPAVSYGPHEWRARVSVLAPSASEATIVAVKACRLAARMAGVPLWPIVEVAAQEAADLAAELERPNIPPLAGVSEAAALLGLSRQRVSTLAHRPDFPQPLAQLAAGPVWVRPAIERFAETWDRKPGRPSRATVDDEAVLRSRS